MSNKVYLMDLDSDSSSDYSFDLSAEITDQQELIILYSSKYIGEESIFCKKGTTRKAIVDQENTLLMANHLHVDVANLINVLCEEFWDHRPSAHACDAEDCFADILDFILDCGAKYKLK